MLLECMPVSRFIRLCCGQYIQIRICCIVLKYEANNDIKFPSRLLFKPNPDGEATLQDTTRAYAYRQDMLHDL